MATVKRLDTFILRDKLGLTKDSINKEAEACAIRRSETMGWVNVSTHPASASVSLDGEYKCYSFEIWGEEAKASDQRAPFGAGQKRSSDDLNI